MAKYFLAVDYGDKKCGLAIADDETKIASSYKIIETVGLLEEIKKINEENPVKKIILGNFKLNEIFENKKQIEKIAHRIEKEEKIKIGFQDEIFSTKIAQDNLKELNKKNISGQDDAEAARIILQSWLDKK